MHSLTFSRLALALSWLLAAQPTLACSSPTLNGNASNVGTGPDYSAPPNTVSLTTTLTNDIIVLEISTLTNNDGTVGSVPNVIATTSDTAGLTWTRRGTRHTYSATGANGYYTVSRDIFWAYSSGILTGDTISWTYAGTNETYVLGLAYGVHGVASFVSPYDTNGALPAEADNPSGTTTQPAVTMATTMPATLLITSCTLQVNAICTPPTGWTLVTVAGANHVCCDINTTISAKAQAGALSSTSVNVNNATSQYWLAMGDALVGDQTGCVVGALQFQTPISYQEGEKPRVLH